MRFLMALTLIVLLPRVPRAESRRPHPRAAVARVDALKAARGVARYQGGSDGLSVEHPKGQDITAVTDRPSGDGSATTSTPAPPAPSSGSATASPAPAFAPMPPSASPTTASAPAASAPADKLLIGPPPPLTLSSRRLVVPAGETCVVTISGTLKAPELTTTADGIVTTGVTPGPLPGIWSLTVQGLSPGAAEIRVSADTRAQLLTVRVMKYAGEVGSASIEVTGQPAPAEFVLREARAALEDAVKREPGATVSITSPAHLPPELPAGQAAAVSFPVTISGPDLLPVKVEATVTVRNRDLDQREVGVLLYSNQPERLAHPGTLFEAELTPDRPARLLYHHQNSSDAPLRVRLELVNPTDQPADVQVIEGAAGPTWDAVEAGHRAASRYIRSALQDLGTIVHVAARSELAIALQRLTPGSTVSGLFGLRSLDARLFVRVAAAADAEPAVALRPAEIPDRLSDQVYLSPRRPLSVRYVVGKAWAFLKLGGDPFIGRGSHPKLFGNYGVSYEWGIDLSNPTDQPQSVVLTLSPDAGSARGVFVIDGAVVEAPAVGPPVEADLATFHLQPGERRAVRLQTIPVGGSSYPARLVIRPAGPLRSAQAVTGAK